MLSIKTTTDFADEHLAEHGRLVISTGHLVPDQFLKTFRKAVAAQDRVPAKTYRLRRSVRYQLLGDTATVQWLAPYAAVQEAGQANGKVFVNYTKDGTGRGFGQMAFNETRRTFMRDFAAAHPEIGLK